MSCSLHSMSTVIFHYAKQRIPRFGRPFVLHSRCVLKRPDMDNQEAHDNWQLLPENLYCYECVFLGKRSSTAFTKKLLFPKAFATPSLTILLARSGRSPNNNIECSRLPEGDTVTNRMDQCYRGAKKPIKSERAEECRNRIHCPSRATQMASNDHDEAGMEIFEADVHLRMISSIY